MAIFIDTEKLLMELDHKSSVDCMDNCYEIYDAVSRNWLSSHEFLFPFLERKGENWDGKLVRVGEI